jgi:hypothetical protein
MVTVVTGITLRIGGRVINL